MLRVEVDPADIQREKGGLEIAVRGIKGERDAVVPVQIFAEVDEGKLVLHIWDGTSEDPSHVIEIEPS